MNSSIKLDINSVIVTLAGADQYKDKLKEIPHGSFLDLSIVYRMLVKKAGEEERFVLVTNAMMEKAKISMDTLREYAYANLLKLYGISRASSKNGTYLLTNEKKTFGAALMLYTFILEGIAEGMQDDLYIVPISVHECMAVPKRNEDVGKLMENLKKSNQDAIDKEELLSDNIYYYNWVEKELSVYKK